MDENGNSNRPKSTFGVFEKEKDKHDVPLQEEARRVVTSIGDAVRTWRRARILSCVVPSRMDTFIVTQEALCSEFSE
jgi:hypothetical protein